MVDVDPERAGKLVSSMRESLGLLQELAEMTEGDFKSNRHLQSSAKYNFVTAIEAAIDLGNHVIAHNRFRAPEDYSDTFKVLSEEGILTPVFAEELGRMAKFRNRLVHVYWDVNIAELWRILQGKLQDFEKYLDAFSSPSSA